MEAKMTTIIEVQKAKLSLSAIELMKKEKKISQKSITDKIPSLQEFKGKLQKGITIETLLRKKLIAQINRILNSKDLINVLGAQQGTFAELLKEIKALMKEEKHKKVTNIDKSLLRK
jgi:hypothetical protein